DRIIGHENCFPKQAFVWTADGVFSSESYEQYRWHVDGLAMCDEIGAMYFAHLRETGRAPKDFADLHEYSDRFPKGYEAIKVGRWFVNWNTLPTDNQDENFDIVLAYENSKVTTRIAFWAVTADRSERLIDPKVLEQTRTGFPTSHEIWKLHSEYSKEH